MDWYYAANGQQVGPVSEAQLEDLIGNGTVQGTTLVWRVGLAEWQPLQSVRPGVTSGPSPVPTPGQASLRLAAVTSACAECQRILPQSEMVYLNRSWVCEQCKPIFVQRMKEGVGPIGGQLWRFKKQLVCRPGSSWPDRCVKCNQGAQGGRLKRQLYWHSPLVYLLILLNLLIYVIVALLVRKRAAIEIGVCQAHRRQRIVIISCSWFAVLAGITMLIYGTFTQGWVSLLGVIIFLVAAIVGGVMGPLVVAAKIDKDFVWVKGVCPEYLDTLPEWLGQ